MPSHRRLLLAGTLVPVLVAVLAATTACGSPPQAAPPEGPLPGPPTSGPGNFRPPPSGPPGTATPPAEQAVDCNGEPDGEEILDLLREVGLLGADTDVEVDLGPLCAEGWQYTVIVSPGLDPLQVVTSGEPGDLSLVTAGTNVCTIEVRVEAPDGIRTVASCVG